MKQTLTVIAASLLLATQAQAADWTGDLQAMERSVNTVNENRYNSLDGRITNLSSSINTSVNNQIQTLNTSLTSVIRDEVGIIRTEVDNKVDSVNSRIGEVEKQYSAIDSRYSGAIAGLAAMNNVPTVLGKSSFGVGLGAYNGQTGYALGYSVSTRDNIALKFSVSGSSSGTNAYGAGAAFSW
jgi:autotransporter adhesin